jgi:uncharacterized protein
MSLAFASLVGVVSVAHAGVAEAQSLPALTAPVNDFAHVIDEASAAALDTRIRALQSTTGDAVVVLTVQTFAPYGSIEEFAVKEFEQAKIGERGKDNGALVVLAVNERRVRIEVGYGLEEYITDGFSGDVIRQNMLPAFRGGQYGPGLLAGTTAVIQRIADARGVTLRNVPAAENNNSADGGTPLGFIILVFVILAILGTINRRRGGFMGGMWGGPWSGWGGGFGGGGFGGGFGGGGGGGFGGFGGGRSGGGGASGGW